MGLGERKRRTAANVERDARGSGDFLPGRCRRVLCRLRRGPCCASQGMKLLIFVGVNLGGCAGWELGERFGTMTAFLLSGAGSVVGVYAGWWVARKYIA